MELQIFSNSEFGEIRTITKDDEPMFCLADVCKALEISNVGNVKRRIVLWKRKYRQHHNIAYQ